MKKNEYPNWASAWDGREKTFLSNLAVRAYVAACGHVLYAVDDAPGLEDGLVDLWIDKQVPVDFPDVVLALLESGYRLTQDGVMLTLTDGLLHFRCHRNFRRLSQDELLALSGEAIATMARSDISSMDKAFLHYQSLGSPVGSSG